jgi:hypothetical protein
MSAGRSFYEIRQRTGGKGFDRAAWIELVSHRPEFKRYPSSDIVDPFTKSKAIVYATDDVAEVIVMGKAVGQVYWSMSDESLVNVNIDVCAVSLAYEWAKELDGELKPVFFPDAK